MDFRYGILHVLDKITWLLTYIFIVVCIKYGILENMINDSIYDYIYGYIFIVCAAFNCCVVYFHLLQIMYDLLIVSIFTPTLACPSGVWSYIQWFEDVVHACVWGRWDEGEHWVLTGRLPVSSCSQQGIQTDPVSYRSPHIIGYELICCICDYEVPVYVSVPRS